MCEKSNVIFSISEVEYLHVWTAYSQTSTNSIEIIDFFPVFF